jgi:hypothetical protein
VRTAVVGAAIVILALSTLHGQTAFKKTPWGDPDLQGTWTNQTLTPLERPTEFVNKPVLTEAEAKAYEAKLKNEGNADLRAPGTRRDVTTAYNDVVGPRQSDRRRSPHLAGHRSR